MEYFLAGPSRAADHLAEIHGPDGGLFAGEHIGFDVRPKVVSGVR